MKSAQKRRLALVFGFVFIDLLGYSLVLPLLPYYADRYGASLVLVGLLGAANALAQLLAAPVIGRLSDRHGRRPLLIASIAGTVAGFLILGTARSLLVIFLAVIVDGLFGGNTSLARAYATDITSEKTRSRGLGIIGAATGLGFIIGPAMGGFLTRYGLSVPAYVAAGLALLNLIAVALWLPESLSAERRERIVKQGRARITPKAMVAALGHACTGPLLLSLFLYSVAFNMFQTNFSVFSKAALGLPAATTSYILTYVGAVSVVVQGVGVGKLTDWFGEQRVMAWGAVLLTLSLFAWALVSRIVPLLIVLAPMALAAGSVSVTLNSQVTQSVNEDDVGGALGLGSSLQILSRTLAPALGGLLLQVAGGWTLGVVGGLVMAVGTVVIWRRVLPITGEDLVRCRGEEGA